MVSRLVVYAYVSGDERAVEGCFFFFQAEDGIRDAHYCLEFRRVLFRSTVLLIYWLPILLEQQGVPIGTAIVTTSILNGAGILGGIVLAFLADRVGAPRVIVVASFAASLAVVLIGVAAPNVPAAVMLDRKSTRLNSSH